MRVFFSHADYRAYKGLLTSMCLRYRLDIWAFCLMPNHVHLIGVPATQDGLARPIGEAHRRYALSINRRQGWVGHLWQERFSSFAMDEAHSVAAIRYILLNPVRAGLADHAIDWPHSSARAHVDRRTDGLVRVSPAAELVTDWDAFLTNDGHAAELETLRRHGRVGRPLGSAAFVRELEHQAGRRLRPRKVGRKPKRK
jgi:putative transposase